MGCGGYGRASLPSTLRERASEGITDQWPTAKTWALPATAASQHKSAGTGSSHHNMRLIEGSLHAYSPEACQKLARNYAVV